MRRVLITGLLALVALVAAGCESQPKAGESVSYLFAQTADRVTIDQGTATMGGVASSTIYFSDRPDRIAGQMTNEQFLDLWYSGDPDSFKDNPPNASLMTTAPDGVVDLVVVLRNPRLAGDTLTYDITVLEGVVAPAGGATSLVIDVITDHTGASLVAPLHDRPAHGRPGQAIPHTIRVPAAYGHSGASMVGHPHEGPGHGRTGAEMSPPPRDHTGGELAVPPREAPPLRDDTPG